MPKKISKEELEKLPLRERLEKLRELAKEDEEELKETEDLIKKTERDLIREESSTDTGPSPEPINLDMLVEEAPSSQEPTRVEEEAAKYKSYTPDYKAIKRREEQVREEGAGKYKPATDDAAKSVATHTLDKEMKKKYSRDGS